MRLSHPLFTVGVLLVLASSAWAADPTLVVVSASGQAGGTVDLAVNFNTGTALVATFQFDLTLPGGFTAATVTAGAIVTDAGKSLDSNVIGGNTARFLAFGLNQSTIAGGKLLTVRLNIAATVAPGSYTVPISGVVYADPNANPISP